MLGTVSTRHANVGIFGVYKFADVWVFQIFAIHFVGVNVLGGSDEAECTVEFVVVVRGFSEYMVLCHVDGDRVHSLFDECEASYGIMHVFRGRSEFVEYRCNPLGPAGVVD